MITLETLILASHSPRRQELLRRVGLPFEASAPEVDETCTLPAAQAVEELSRRKALAAAQLYPGRFVLGADTLVALDGVSLGKPADREDARRMLRTLSGRTHDVFTGMTVVSPAGEVFSGADANRVTFAPLAEAEIDAYLETGEPMDKAGAYAIQGRFSLFVTHLSGTEPSVMGLSLRLLRDLLLRAGYFAPGAAAPASQRSEQRMMD